jgi:hypothetical protein
MRQRRWALAGEGNLRSTFVLRKRLPDFFPGASRTRSRRTTRLFEPAPAQHAPDGQESAGCQKQRLRFRDRL